MTKDNKSPFEILFEGIGIYIKHFPVLAKYMAFPVFGQLIGLFLSLFLPFWYLLNTPQTLMDGQDNIGASFTVTLLLSVPGLILFTKAFWEYLVAYVSINSMAENTVKSGRIYDIVAHKKVATSQKRIADFIVLWLLFGLFTVVAILPPMWVFALFIFVFISLIFQVFTFEKNLTPRECFIKSKNLVKSNYWGTALLLILIGILTYCILPKLVEFVFDFLQILGFLASLLDTYVQSLLPIEQINTGLAALNINYVIASFDVSKMIVSSFISMGVFCFTLPIRSICCTLWYKQLSIKEIKAKSKQKKSKEA